MVVGDQAAREQAVDALQRATDDRHGMERNLADRFIREMRLAVRLSPSDVRHHLEDLVSDDIERRLAVVECAVARTAIPFRLQALAPEAAATVMRLPQFRSLSAEDAAVMREQLSRLAYEASRTVSADETMKSKESSNQTKVDRCAEFLKDLLKDFAHPSDEILIAAQSAGYTFDNVTKAKIVLKAGGLKNSNMGRFRGKWWSGFGIPEDWTPRPGLTQESQESH